MEYNKARNVAPQQKNGHKRTLHHSFDVQKKKLKND